MICFTHRFCNCRCQAMLWPEFRIKYGQIFAKWPVDSSIKNALLKKCLIYKDSWDNMASVGWKKKYPEDFAYFMFFLGTNNFLFVEVEGWHFQHLFDFKFHQTTLNFSSLRQHSDNIFSVGNKKKQMRWNFVRFHKILNQKDVENFNFL